MENFHKNNFYSVQTVYLLILFLNIILTEIILYSNGIHSYQISIEKSTFRNVMEWEIHIMDVQLANLQQLRDVVPC